MDKHRLTPTEVLLPGGIVSKLHIRPDSPLTICKDNNKLYVKIDNEFLTEFMFLPRPNFWNYKTQSGMPTKKFAQMYGLNALNFNIYSGCEFWNVGKGCKFCSVKNTVGKDNPIEVVKNAKELADVCELASKYDNLKYIIITGGSHLNTDDEFNAHMEVIKAIRYKLPWNGLIKGNVSMMPPKDLTKLKALYDNQVENPSFNMEVWPKENFEKFIKEIINTDYAIAWGKVKTQNIVGFIPHLIKIDKNLSHDFIRPFLWKFNIGISVPGQIFLISKKYYLNKFHTIDTVYDDLTLGIIAKSNKMPVYFNNYILGYETPKGNFKDLLKQRRRWAKGLAESIYNNRNSKSLKYVKIHGFMYHFLWIVYYLIILFCSLINYRIGIIIFLLTGLILSEFKLKDLIYGYAYLLIFPIIHLFWLKSFIKNFKILYKK